jgi:hypothetical protein
MHVGKAPPCAEQRDAGGHSASRSRSAVSRGRHGPGRLQQNVQLRIKPQGGLGLHNHGQKSARGKFRHIGTETHDALGRARLDINREQVIADRRSGMSLTQVARKHSISRASVCRLMKEATENSSPALTAALGLAQQAGAGQ